MGHYKLAPDREISLSWHDPSDGPIYFFEDNEQVVRLYPIGPRDFLSERLETLSIATSPEGTPTSASWKPFGANTLPAEHLPWCREEQILIPVEDYHLAGTLLLHQPAARTPW